VRSAYSETDLIAKLRGIRLKLHDARKLDEGILTDNGKQDLRAHS
jgi:hypothetical protein